MVANSFGPHPQNSGLREVDMVPTHKRGSNKIDMLRETKNRKHNTKQVIAYSLLLFVL